MRDEGRGRKQVINQCYRDFISTNISYYEVKPFLVIEDDDIVKPAASAVGS
jgi:hypothetical protein